MDRPSYCFHGYLIYSRFDSECLIWRYEKKAAPPKETTSAGFLAMLGGGALFLLYATKAGRHSRLKGKIRVKKGTLCDFFEKIGERFAWIKKKS